MQLILLSTVSTGTVCDVVSSGVIRGAALWWASYLHKNAAVESELMIYFLKEGDIIHWKWTIFTSE